jgi:hypothetical protein
MTESVTVLYDEETLSFDVPDAALEKCWEGPASWLRFHFARDWTAARPFLCADGIWGPCWPAPTQEIAENGVKADKSAA